MRTIPVACVLFVFCFLHGYGQSVPLVGTAAWTNAIRAKSVEQQQAWELARQAAQDHAPTGLQATNGAPQPKPPVDQIKREIQSVPGGAVADYGRLKVEFANDIVDPVTVTMPDGQVLRFRADSVVFYDSATDQATVLGTLTNSLGVIVSSNKVCYSNAFANLPGAHVLYEYDAVRGALTQFIVLEKSPALPLLDSGVIEVWSWFDGTEAVSAEKREVEGREATVDGGPVKATDMAVSFGSVKLEGDGKAFSLSDPQSTVPVAKAWNPLGQKGQSGGAAVLIESVDWKSLAPKLQGLPETKRPKSVSNTRLSRSKLLASVSTGNGSMAGVMANSAARGSSTVSGSQTMLLAQAAQAPTPAAVIDFTIICSVPVPADAVSWWPAGGTANDAVGSNHGYLTNGATYAAGEVGQGFSFDGVNDYVAVPKAASLDVSQVTVEFWMRANATNQMTSYQGLVTTPYYGVEISRGLQQRYGVIFYVSTDSGQSFAMTSEAGTNAGGAVITAGAWHHVAGTYDGSQIQLYIDGQPWGEPTAQSGNISPMLNLSGAFLAVGSEDGRANAGYTGTRYFGGAIDEVSIYSRALAASEILDLYNAGSAGKNNPNCVSPSTNAVAWWAGDGNTYDLARTNIGTLKNGATHSAGRVAQAFDLNSDGGSDDYVEVPQNSAWAFAGNNFSIELWLNFRSLPTRSLGNPEAVFVGADSGGGTTNKWFFALGGRLINFHVNSPSLGSKFLVQAAFNPSLNTWYHVAAVRSGTTMTIYTNGVVAGTDTINFDIPGVTAPLTIGQAEGIGYFNGQVDELTIYNRALSGTEVGGIYSAGGAGKCKVDTDSDGLSDLQEAFLGTNPNSVDSNGDGLNDGDEVFIYHTNPTNSVFKVLINRPAPSGNIP